MRKEIISKIIQEKSMDKKLQKKLQTAKYKDLNKIFATLTHTHDIDELYLDQQEALEIVLSLI